MSWKSFFEIVTEEACKQLSLVDISYTDLLHIKKVFYAYKNRKNIRLLKNDKSHSFYQNNEEVICIKKFTKSLKFPNGGYILSKKGKQEECKSIENLIFILKIELMLMVGKSEKYEKHSEIETISPKFYSIFEDAMFLENVQSTNAGMVYRKALEYLIIDTTYYFIEDKEQKENFSKNFKQTNYVLEKFQEIAPEIAKEFMKLIKENIELSHNFVHHREGEIVTMKDICKIRENIEIIIGKIREKIIYKQRSDETKSRNEEIKALRKR